MRSVALERQPALAAYRASLSAAEEKAQGLDRLVLAGLVRRDLPTRRKQASLGIVASKAQLDKAEWDTLYAVTRNYLSATYARQQRQIAKDLLDPSVEKVFTLAFLRKLANDAFMGSTRRDIKKWHVDQIDVIVQVAQGRVEEAKQGEERALAALREAIGLEADCPLMLPSGNDLPEGNAPPDKAAIVALALQRRDEIVQAGIGAEVTCLEIEAQQVIFGASAQTFASASDLHAQPIPQGISNSEYRPGAISIEMPTTLVGKRDARVHQAQALHGRAQAVVDKTRHLVTLEAEDVYLRWQETSAKSAQFRKAAESARKVFDRIREEFDPAGAAGSRPNFDDLVEARTRALRLQLLANQSHYEMLLTLAALERVTAGGFSAGLDRPSPTKSEGK
jgi:outer membrane protein TolC